MQDGAKARYYLWQVERGSEPGPALRKLVEIGMDETDKPQAERAVGPLVEKHLDTCDAAARRRLLMMLRDIDYPDALRPAVKLIADPDPRVRAEAVLIFRQYCTPDQREQYGHLKLLYKMLDDPDPSVLARACSALCIVTGIDIEPSAQSWKDYINKHPELQRQLQ